MKIIEKVDTNFVRFLKQFEWLNFDDFRESDGYGFQLYFPEERLVTNEDLIKIFYKLFTPFLKQLVISLLEPNVGNGGWGDFCLETWNMQKNTYDYTPPGKSRETALYLQMLEDSGIEPTYNGLCSCRDWEEFLPIILDCVMTHKALYSFYFYDILNQFIFYFHHTGSLGIYYKQFNDAIMYILKQAKAENLELWNWNDEKSLAMFKG